MKVKWYLGALLIVLSVLGLSQYNGAHPNQEIILNFTDENTTSDEAQRAIVLVKNQLQSIGAASVKVHELNKGTLKITYYSPTDVSSVKNLLVNDKHLEVGYASHSKQPKPLNEKDYKLEVYELQNNDLETSGLNGKCMLSAKQDFDRFHSPKVNTLYKKNTQVAAANNTFKVALKVFKAVESTIEKTSQDIPDVRAGPIC